MDSEVTIAGSPIKTQRDQFLNPEKREEKDEKMVMRLEEQSQMFIHVNTLVLTDKYKCRSFELATERKLRFTTFKTELKFI